MNEAVALYNRSLEFLGEGGHAPDHARAFALNAKAAEMGWASAVLAMGWHYLNGCGVTRDVARAKDWYRRSARAGEPMAMFSLGQMAYRAGGHAEARRWFERAAHHGHARSLYWVGKMSWRGHGMERDRARAFALFHRAAQAHEAEAVRALRFLSRRRRQPRL